MSRRRYVCFDDRMLKSKDATMDYIGIKAVINGSFIKFLSKSKLELRLNCSDRLRRMRLGMQNRGR